MRGGMKLQELKRRAEHTLGSHSGRTHPRESSLVQRVQSALPRVGPEPRALELPTNSIDSCLYRGGELVLWLRLS